MNSSNFDATRSNLKDWKMTCEMFDDDSDVAQLEALQKKLLVLNDDNFEETKDWILHSIFTRSEEGIHDLIYTIYLISATRANYQRSQILSRLLSRMITSLYNSDATKEFLCLIPKYATELLALSTEMDLSKIIQELNSASILDQSKYESIKNRKMPIYDSIKIINDEIREMNGQNFLYPRLIYNSNSLISIIREDNLNSMIEMLNERKDQDEEIEIYLPLGGMIAELSILDYAAFNGSVNCFMKLIEMGNEISTDTIECAVYGGNKEILNIIKQRNISLLPYLSVTCEYFHNDLFDELKPDLNNIKATNNIHVLRYLLQEGVKLGITAYNTHSIILTKFFHDNFKTKECYNIAFFNACKSGDVGLVRYLYQNFPKNIKYHQGCLNAFHVAVIENQVGVVEYLRQQKGIHFNNNDIDLFRYVINNNQLHEMLYQLTETYGIEFTGRARNGAICSNDPEILKILFNSSHIRCYFNISKSLTTCIQNNCLKSLKFLLDFDVKLDCCQILFDIADEDTNVVMIVKMILAKVDNLKPEEFATINPDIWKNINELESWLLKESCLIEHKDLILYLMKERKTSINKETFALVLKHFICRTDFYQPDESIDWLIAAFSDYYDQNKEEILAYCRENSFNQFLYHHHEAFFAYLSHNEIFEMLYDACIFGFIDVIKEHQDILPNYINESIEGSTLLSSTFENKEIVEILIDVSGLDASLSIHKSTIFDSYGTYLFDKLMEKFEIDLNVYGTIDDVRMPLFARIAIKNYEKFIDILSDRQDININAPMIVERLTACDYSHSLIHFFVTENMIKQLAVLLNYPAIDVNIFDSENNSPLILAIRYKNIDAVKLLLSHQQIDVNLASVTDEYETCPLFEALSSTLEIFKEIIMRKDIIFDISLKNGKNIQKVINSGELNIDIAKYLMKAIKKRKWKS